MNDFELHIPPQSIEAEMSILGAIFVDNDAINKSLEIITEGDFYQETHRKIFRAMLDLHGQKKPLDLITMTEALKVRGELEEVGGAPFLITLIDYVPTAANIYHYCRIVKDKAVARKALAVSRDLQARIQGCQPSATTIDEARRSLDVLSGEADAMSGVNADDLIDFTERNRLYMQFVRKMERYRFITGFPCLDKGIRGVAPGEVLTIAAYSGTFKSALLQYLLFVNGDAKVYQFRELKRVPPCWLEKFLNQVLLKWIHLLSERVAWRRHVPVTGSCAL